MRIKIILFLLLAVNIFAQQDTTGVIRLTLDDAISIALENNWDMKISQQGILRAEEQINEAYSNAFPSLNFSGRYTRNFKLPVLFIPPNTPINPSSQTQKFELGSKNAVDAGITLTQVLYNQKVNTAISIAGEYASLSKVGNKATSNEVVLNVKKAFYNVLLLKELVNVSQQSYNFAKASLDVVTSMYKQGMTSEFDYLRAEVQVANIQPELIRVQNNLELSKNYLKSLLAIDLNRQIEVIGEFKFEEVPVDVMESFNEEAITNNPLIQQLTIQSSLLGHNITIEKSEYYPSLAMFGAYNWQSQDNTFQIKKWQWAESFMVGLQLNYTIFDGFRRGARIEQAKIDQETVNLNKNKLTEGIRIQVLQAKMKMDEAQRRIEAQEKSLKQAQRAVEIGQTRYKNGVGTQLELIDTQTALQVANTNYAQAIFDYLVAKADWEYAVSYSK
ncbi:MAG: TolC family protein [Syntrophothermus sp.]